MSTRERVDPSSTNRRYLDWRSRTTAVLLVLFVTSGSVSADVRLNGSSADVHVDATRSTTSEVLSALATTYGLQIKTRTALDRTVDGTFAGSLAEILSSILQDYDYFIRWEKAGVQVTIVASHHNRANSVNRVPPPPPTPAISLAQAARLNRRMIHSRRTEPY